MYLANPITRKIQAIRLHRDGAEYRLQKLPDFVQSSDEMFRPVAIKFGPDGCLYIVDWYNKIISHNEVPRNHPERDKKRGRIWRVRHEDQKRLEVPDFTRLPEVELLARLGHPALAQHHLAWQAIIDRGLTNQAPALRAIVLEKNSMATRRIGGLWALEGLQRVDRSLLENLLADPNRNIRREAIRVLGAADALWNPELVRPLLNDPDPQVRAEIIAAAGARAGKEIGALTLCAALARPALDGPMGRSTQSGKPIKVGEAYVREFERYLVRLFLEKEPEAVARFLASNLGKEMPLENRIWLSLAIDPRAGAREVAALVPLVQRAPSSEELLRIAQFPAEPGVAEAWQKILSDTRHRLSSVEQLMKVRSRFDAAPLRPLLSQVVSNLFGTPGGGSAAALQLITGFKLELFEPVLAQRLPSAPVQEQLLLLRALRELNSKRIDLFADLARRFPGLRDEALGALAAIKETKSAEASIKLSPELNPQQKRTLLSSLAGHASGAQALVSSLESGDLTVEDLDGGVVEKLQTVLAGEEQGAALIRQLGARLKPVLRLEGKDNSWVESGISLAGPFTVEAWVKLDPGIDNNDGLLGAPGVVDMNFHDGRFRVWVAGLNDLVVARKKVTPSSWTHLAVSRDGVGEFRIFLNGELDSTQSTRATNQWNDLRIAWTGPSQGTAGELAEFRIWNRPRTEQEIRNDFDRSYAASDGQSAEKTNGLVYWFGGTAWGKVQPGARVVKTLDYPALLTAEESRQQQEKFAAFRSLATRPGNLSQGEQIFKANCAVCHSVNGQGGQVGPVLNGAGAAGVESLLRNLLTPSAAMEAGYRAYRVELKNGELVEGIFQGENEQGILLRRPNVEEARISPAEIKRAGYGKRSLMPEGMLEALPPSQVTDLMAYLLSLK